MRVCSLNELEGGGSKLFRLFFGTVQHIQHVHTEEGDNDEQDDAEFAGHFGRLWLVQ
jgi:hypothetical protein